MSEQIVFIVGASPEDLARKEVDLLQRTQAQGGSMRIEPLPDHFRIYRVDRPDDIESRLRTLHHGDCPRCGKWKFIGHGPLCVDCYTPTQTDERGSDE